MTTQIFGKRVILKSRTRVPSVTWWAAFAQGGNAGEADDPVWGVANIASTRDELIWAEGIGFSPLLLRDHVVPEPFGANSDRWRR